MVSYHNADGVLEVRHRHEVIRIEAWGADSVRVRAAQYRIPDGSVGALDDARPAGPAGDVKIVGTHASLACGRLRAEVPDYQELVVRWFQYGVFCPLFRLHGDRYPRVPTGHAMTGGPNEVWLTAGTGARHDGGTALSVPVSIDRMPVFAREGAEVLDVVR